MFVSALAVATGGRYIVLWCFVALALGDDIGLRGPTTKAIFQLDAMFGKAYVRGRPSGGGCRVHWRRLGFALYPARQVGGLGNCTKATPRCLATALPPLLIW